MGCHSVKINKNKTPQNTPKVDNVPEQVKQADIPKPMPKPIPITSAVNNIQKTAISCEVRANSDTITNLELKANFYFDSERACIEYVFLDTLFSLCQMEKCIGDQSLNDFLEFCKKDGRSFGKKTFDQDLQLLTQDVTRGEITTNAVNWYTKESFLYPLINNTYRGGAFQAIFRARYYINLLNRNLNRLMQNPVTELFRGSVINKEEFQVFRSNKGKPILLRGFISTSAKVSVAEDFLKNRKADDKKYKILLRIRVDEKHQNMIHSIKEYSQFPDEEEFLLNSYSIITVDNITMSQDIVNVDCSFSDFEACKELSLFNPITLDYQEKYKEILNENYTNDNFILVDMLHEMARYDESLTILNEITDTSPQTLATKLNKQGLVYYEKGKFSTALESQEQALKIQMKTLGTNHPETALTYNYLGMVYDAKGEFSNALNNYNLCLNSLGEKDKQTATVYTNIGVVYSRQGDYENALNNLEKASKIYIEMLGDKNIPLATLYGNIGSVYHSKGEYDTALMYFEKSLNIFLFTSGRNHPNIITAYNNIATVYFEKEDLDTALKYFIMSATLQIKIYTENHSSIAITYANFGKIFYRKRDYHSALFYLFSALKIQIGALGINHPSTAMIYTYIGSVYRSMNNKNLAISYYEQALLIQIPTLGENNWEVANTYLCLGDLYYKKVEFKHSLLKYERAVNGYVRTFGDYHRYTLDMYSVVAQRSAQCHDYHTAIKYYEIILGYYLTTDPKHDNIGKCYYDIGKAYEHANIGDKALENFEKALVAFKSSIGEINIEIANVYLEMGLVYYRYGNCVNGDKYFAMKDMIKSQLHENKKNDGINQPQAQDQKNEPENEEDLNYSILKHFFI